MPGLGGSVPNDSKRGTEVTFDRINRRSELINLGEEICECYRHAEDCARKATAQLDPKLKQDFLDLEQRWLFLARSYEFTQRLTECSDETTRQADKSP